MLERAFVSEERFEYQPQRLPTALEVRLVCFAAVWGPLATVSRNDFGRWRRVVDLMDVHEQVDLDYARARRRALVGRLAAWARRRCAELWAFDEARRELGAENRRFLGRKSVEVGRVVGSVGRWREFDAGFMPARASAGR